MALIDSNEVVCDYCDTPICNDFWYEINGDVLCKQCLYENFMVKASDICADEGDEDE